MGQHSGSGTAGVKGKVQPLGPATRVIDDGNMAVDAFDPAIGEQLDISALAMGNAELAIDTFAKVMKSRKSSATAKVAAAKANLEFAAGKPGPKEAERRDTGLQIVVNYLLVKPGEPRPVIDITPERASREIEDAQFAEISSPHEPTPDLVDPAKS